MFCQKCGKEIEGDTKFCPNCGNQIVIMPQQAVNDYPTQEKPKKKKKKKWLIGVIAAIVIIGLGIVIFSDDGISPDELIELVQNGYLGNYDTVTVKEVLEYVSKNGDWKAGETADRDHYVVEYSGDDIRVQFSIDGLDANTFQLSGIKAEDIDMSEMEAYDVKVYMDDLYGLYAVEYPQKGLYIDKSISNDTLKGHIGPVKPVEESESAASEVLQMQDLSVYANYTEDELIDELGYDKNEYGFYPEESHINFMFEDGKMGYIVLNASKAEDINMALWGVTLNDSLKDAAEILKNNGFDYYDVYEMDNGMMDIFLQKETGYSYSVRTDNIGAITRLSYELYDLEELENLFEEDSEDSNDENIIIEEITYGTYAYNDGISKIYNAEVGFFTDESIENYISVKFYKYRENEETILFYSVMENNTDGSYTAYSDDYETIITVIFGNGGLYIEVDNSDAPYMYEMEGFYELEEVLNLDEVG